MDRYMRGDPAKCVATSKQLFSSLSLSQRQFWCSGSANKWNNDQHRDVSDQESNGYMGMISGNRKRSHSLDQSSLTFWLCRPVWGEGRWFCMSDQQVHACITPFSWATCTCAHHSRKWCTCLPATHASGDVCAHVLPLFLWPNCKYLMAH